MPYDLKIIFFNFIKAYKQTYIRSCVEIAALCLQILI